MQRMLHVTKLFNLNSTRYNKQTKSNWFKLRLAKWKQLKQRPQKGIVAEERIVYNNDRRISELSSPSINRNEPNFMFSLSYFHVNVWPFLHSFGTPRARKMTFVSSTPILCVYNESWHKRLKGKQQTTFFLCMLHSCVYTGIIILGRNMLYYNNNYC